MKRGLDVLLAAIGLTAAAPLLVPLCLVVWAQDFSSPFYLAPRVRARGRVFRMIKLRSMVVAAPAVGGTSTSGDDPRITPIGRFIRRFKLDEIPQLWNVLRGEMSLVGPRPQTQRDADLYTDVEWRLLDVRPGITDFASIVFSDEGEILRGHRNPDLHYQQVIRPWKSRLGLLYAEKHSLRIDLALIGLTLVGIWSRSRALAGVAALLHSIGADDDLVRVARREQPLVPGIPPGALAIESRF